MKKRLICMVLASLLLVFAGAKAYTIWHDNELILTASTHEHIVNLQPYSGNAFGRDIEKLLFDEDSKQIEIVMKRDSGGLRSIGLSVGESGEPDWGSLINQSHIWCRHVCYVYDLEGEPGDLYIVDGETNEKQLLSE